MTIRHLNADSSFLLIFSPVAQPTPSDLLSVNGAFSVLIDPWLIGSSIVNAKWFAITHRIIPSSIKHLSEIGEPDVVLISQNKPDHCHKETLLQLSPEGKTVFAAEPGAAKAIKSWNHFDPTRVHALAKHDAKARFGNTLRVRIPELGPDGLPGELNIAFIPARNYVTGLHNAFGITYQAPTRVKTLAPVVTIDLPKGDLSSPLTPVSIPATSPQSNRSISSPHSHTSNDTSYARPTTAPDNSSQRTHRPQLPRSHNTKSSELLGAIERSSILPSQAAVVAGNLQYNDFDDTVNRNDFAVTLPTPPASPPSSSCYTPSPRPSDTSDAPTNASIGTPYSAFLPHSPSLADLQSRYSRAPAVHPARPKAISVLYTPHGIPLADLQPYIKSHLVKLPGALPLTCLLHSFDYASNPWWFGGNIMMGVDSGMEIARALMARCWISAHDEVKDDQGVAVKLLKCDRHNADSVKAKLAQLDDSWRCNVKSLDVGAEICLTAELSTRRKSSGLGFGVSVEQLGMHQAIT